MPRQIVVKAAFKKAYRRLAEPEQRLADSALRHFRLYLESGKAPVGLGMKHLGARTYEFRAGLALRIVYVVEGNQIFLALLGSHDDVHRYLRHQ